MKIIKLSLILIAIILISMVFADQSPGDFDKQIQTQLDDHYNKYKTLEHFTGATLSVYIPGQTIRNYYAGIATQDSLFEIGSITKSFTAAIVLQLEKENKLKLSDTLEKWLPDLSKWSTITIEQLLNMTSGLPNYSDAPLWNAKEYENSEQVWPNNVLISFVYPPENLSPPIKSGYFYTNTGYILIDMIIEKITENSFKTEIDSRLIERLNLRNTFYPVPVMSDEVKSRLLSGYNYNQYDNPALVGKDIKNVNLTWAGAAGAIVSNSEDIIKWVKALFVDNDILDVVQKTKLMHLVSTTTNNFINETTAEDPRGFGLGVVQAYDKNIGRFWFYEGETLGFRALYMYVPCNGIIIASIFNSATNSENDHAGELMKKVYQSLLTNSPKSQCVGI